MIFNSIPFIIFLTLSFSAYWFIIRFIPKLQVVFIVCSSYLFYGTWDWRFLSLIFIGSIGNYYLSLCFGSQPWNIFHLSSTGADVFSYQFMNHYFKQHKNE